MPRSLVLLLVFAALGCQGDATGPSAAADTASIEAHQPGPPATGDFVGRVWIQTSATLPGVMRIFLPDGTLVMDSCWETYRLSRWRAVSDSVVAWQEDTAEVEAYIEGGEGNTMQLRLQLGGETRVEQYEAARVPYVCPEQARVTE